MPSEYSILVLIYWVLNGQSPVGLTVLKCGLWRRTVGDTSPDPQIPRQMLYRLSYPSYVGDRVVIARPSMSRYPVDVLVVAYGYKPLIAARISTV